MSFSCCCDGEHSTIALIEANVLIKGDTFCAPTNTNDCHAVQQAAATNTLIIDHYLGTSSVNPSGASLSSWSEPPAPKNDEWGQFSILVNININFSVLYKRLTFWAWRSIFPLLLRSKQSEHPCSLSSPLLCWEKSEIDISYTLQTNKQLNREQQNRSWTHYNSCTINKNQRLALLLLG